MNFVYFIFLEQICKKNIIISNVKMYYFIIGVVNWFNFKKDLNSYKYNRT